MRKPQDLGKHPLPVVSLFCGCGALDLGFKQAGFEPLLAIDKDAIACTTYEKNHAGVRVLKQDMSTAPKGCILERLAELPQMKKPVV